MALILTGEWLGIERRTGRGREGADDWAFQEASVLDGLVVRKLRIADEYKGNGYPVPRKPCQLRIDVRAFNRRNGEAMSGFELLEWLDDPSGVNGTPKG